MNIWGNIPEITQQTTKNATTKKQPQNYSQRNTPYFPGRREHVKEFCDAY